MCSDPADTVYTLTTVDDRNSPVGPDIVVTKASGLHSFNKTGLVDGLLYNFTVSSYSAVQDSGSMSSPSGWFTPVGSAVVSAVRELSGDVTVGFTQENSDGADFYQIDYAIVPFGEVGNTHRISLTGRF